VLSDECKGRLYNWKFRQAQNALHQERATVDEDALVKALASVFGDVGHFGGNLSEIVRSAVFTLIGDYDDSYGYEDDWQPPVS
jgi:hypothetical protein